MKVAAVVPSAGSGKRMRSSKIDKPLIKIAKVETICYVLKTLQDSPLISEIIISARTKDIPKIRKLVKRNRFTKIKGIVKGGRCRSRSVFNALSKVSPDVNFILIHDVARPFITQDLIRRTVNAARRYSAAVSCVSVKSTIKEVNPRGLMVRRTLDRRLLWEAQTPQVFGKDLLLSAYRKAGKRAPFFTDDASLVENINGKVKVIRGSYNNIKITTPEDLVIAEAIVKSSKL